MSLGVISTKQDVFFLLDQPTTLFYFMKSEPNRLRLIKSIWKIISEIFLKSLKTLFLVIFFNEFLNKKEQKDFLKKLRDFNSVKWLNNFDLLML